jgi:hypothetical protein
VSDRGRPRRFEPGEPVALREIWHGRIGNARPVTIVSDGPEMTMLFIPIGIHWYGADHPRPWVSLKAFGARWRLTRYTWTDSHVLSFAWPGCGYAILHLWDEDWRPRLWYVNVERPLQRTWVGFDTFDRDLDIVIEPDGTAWRWKDEDDVAEGIRLGVYSETDAEKFRREAQRGLRRVAAHQPPFDRDWTTWRPDPTWPKPELPAGWDTEPVTEG